MIKKITVAIVALVALFAMTACESGTASTGEKTEQKSGVKNYDNLVQQEPAKDFTYPVNRKMINFYTETWGKGPKNAYLYLMNNEGNVIGYYVLSSPPVSMCTSLRPPYKVLHGVDLGEYGGDAIVPAPGTDGVFYSGGECNTYYGKDAASGTYIQFTVGQGINPLMYSEPLAAGVVGGAPNLGKTK